jgi:hypothetical protein
VSQEIEESKMKKLDEIHVMDFFQSVYGEADLEKHHKHISGIVLDDDVELKVRNEFDVAKNLALYAYFDNRFYDVAFLKAIDCFELSLRELLNKAENNFKCKKKDTLSCLIERAVKSSILNEKNKRPKDCENCKRCGSEILACDEKSLTCPSQSKTMADQFLYLRNLLAHGNVGFPGCNITLGYIKLCAELISTLYTGKVFDNYYWHKRSNIGINTAQEES